MFSPSAAQLDQHVDRSSTERTPTTVAQSRISDFGSLDTLGQSEQNAFPVADEDVAVQHGGEAEDLDSLDDGLHAFHELADHAEPVQANERFHTTVLPSHDGFGLFQPRSAAVQEQIWQFERQQNARRMNRGRASGLQVALDAMHESVGERDQEEETRARVERWRLEQSRTLLEGIGRETRRLRRLSRTRSRARPDGLCNSRSEGTGSIVLQQATSLSNDAEDVSDERGSEGLLRRFTRRVIRDLLGIDDDVLAVIFGEDYMLEGAETEPPTAASSSGDLVHRRDMGMFGSKVWQHRLLERIARELGTLVHQMCQHPGSFSTYLQTQEIPPYVGSTVVLHAGRVPVSETLEERERDERTESSLQTSAFFPPTLPDHQILISDTDASMWGVEQDAPNKGNTVHHNGEEEAKALRQEREYWERELDIKMVFGFFKNRFSSRNPSPTREAWDFNTTATTATAGAGTGAGFSMSASAASPVAATPTSSRLNHHTTAHTAGAVANQGRRAAPLCVPAHRAAAIRQQHPLASAARRRDLLLRPAQRQAATGAGAGAGAATAVTAAAMGAARAQQRHRTRGSSCASQSSRKSRRTGSSCNYWDIGSSSVGSGPNVNVGAWGEA